MLTLAIEHPAWCDPNECDADPGTGRGCHQARPMTVPYHDQSRSSASVLTVRSPDEPQTWICIELHTVDVQGDPAEYTQLLAPEQARILGRHLLRAGQEAIGPA